MKAKYSGGRDIPSNVLRSLKYLGKVGVISRGTWNQRFGQGSFRWKRKQLQNLKEEGLIQLHTCGSLSDVYVLTEKGHRLLFELNQNSVLPVPPQFIKHDESVASSLIFLEEQGICSQWHTERELKSLSLIEYAIRSKDNEVKYSDAIFKVQIQGKPRTVALEYERTGKSAARYKAILWQYSKMTNFSMILYVTENDIIKIRIKKTLKHLGNVGLLDRIGFMSADGWRNNPLSSKIELKDKVTSFETLCKTLPQSVPLGNT